MMKKKKTERTEQPVRFAYDGLDENLAATYACSGLTAYGALKKARVALRSLRLLRSWASLRTSSRNSSRQRPEKRSMILS